MGISRPDDVAFTKSFSLYLRAFPSKEKTPFLYDCVNTAHPTEERHLTTNGKTVPILPVGARSKEFTVVTKRLLISLY
jgi:hypothetical protein